MTKIRFFTKNTLIFSLPLMLSTALVGDSSAWAWGERGHHLIGYTAAQNTNLFLTPKEREELGLFFLTRKLMMGHLNNIPDISWKDKRSPLTVKLNGPTHYFDIEVLLGEPGDSISDYQSRIRDIPTDIQRFLATYKMNVFKEVGVAPFRIGQLYEKLVSAIKCAKSRRNQIQLHDQKNSKAKKKAPKIEAYTEPILNGDFHCTKDTTFYEAIGAAVQIGGVLGHFVADLSQPLHVTHDYDGFGDGQGSVHAYFETESLHFQDEKLIDAVAAKSADRDFRKSVWQNLKLPETENVGATKIALHLIADSISHKKHLLELDKKFAVVKMGTVIARGTPKVPNSENAVRRPPDDPQVLNGFRDFTIERLALASLVHAKILVQAWREGGSPRLSDEVLYAVPYPLNVPFILPQPQWIKMALDPSEIKSLKKRFGNIKL